MGFHLSLPIGYVDSAPYFSMAMEMMADLANKVISQREQAREHLLELESEARADNNSGAPEAQADTSW